MRILIQRVSEAKVAIGGKTHSSIGMGAVVLLGIATTDTDEAIGWLCKKLSQLRIFPDDEGVMNRSLLDVGGEVLLISQFTLYAATKKGNRPSYIKAARPAQAVPLYEQFISQLQGILPEGKVKTGVFGADMQVFLINDGPVSIWIDSDNRA